MKTMTALITCLSMACSSPHVEELPEPVLGTVDLLSIPRWTKACRTPLELKVECPDGDLVHWLGIDEAWNCDPSSYKFSCTSAPRWSIVVTTLGELDSICFYGPQRTMRAQAERTFAEMQFAPSRAAHLLRILPRELEVKTIDNIVVSLIAPEPHGYGAEACWMK
jgi:hypothetical protein